MEHAFLLLHIQFIPSYYLVKQTNKYRNKISLSALQSRFGKKEQPHMKKINGAC